MARQPDREPKPVIAWDRRYASVQLSETPPAVHEALRRAIATRRLIRYSDRSGQEHTVEPHVFGLRGGADVLLVYEPKASDPWQLRPVTDLADVDVLDAGFEVRQLPAAYDPDQQTNKPRVDGQLS